MIVKYLTRSLALFAKHVTWWLIAVWNAWHPHADKKLLGMLGMLGKLLLAFLPLGYAFENTTSAPKVEVGTWSE